ncbi:5256_t:CDS:2 [Ambispora gerdemannii]|uniref:5256_t:CDS:1 n=1 Tax=Ambispora gerdemannii TaxID=144530 RepID=A0A9N9CPQ6_9GLOM|nr:5256_t:CDS:2 [Ambispora gerdemannii]
MEPIIIKSSQISISPQKLNLVAGIIRKKELDYSLKLLEFLPKKGGRILYKILAGAAKSLEKNKEETTNYYLDKIEVNRGKIQKKVIYRAKEISLVLGEDNTKINSVMKGIYQIINDDKVAVKINLIEVKRIYSHAQSIANLIAGQLKKRMRSRMVIKTLLTKLSAERDVKGVKIEVSGRLDESDIAQTKKIVQGKMPLSTIDSNIDVGRTEVATSYGKIGHVKGNSKINYGEFGLQAQEGAYISNRVIEASRKPLEVRMGSGKGSVERLPKSTSYEVLKRASYKLPIRCKSKKKIQAHNEEYELQLGDKVIIKSSRPYSATKRFLVIKKEEKEGVDFEEVIIKDKNCKVGHFKIISSRLKEFCRSRFNFPLGVDDYLDYTKEGEDHENISSLLRNNLRNEEKKTPTIVEIVRRKKILKIVRFADGYSMKLSKPFALAHFHPECAKKYHFSNNAAQPVSPATKKKILRNLDKISFDQAGHLANAELLKNPHYYGTTRKRELGIYLYQTKIEDEEINLLKFDREENKKDYLEIRNAIVNNIKQNILD